MKNPIIYIVINGELKMSPGKAAAQAVHASMTLGVNSISDFGSQQKRTVIVLEAKNTEQIKNLEEYLSLSDIDADYYIDEGVNEVDAYSATALAAFIGDNHDYGVKEELRKIFEAFPLYDGHVEVKHVNSYGQTKNKIKVPGHVEIESGYAFRKLKKKAK